MTDAILKLANWLSPSFPVGAFTYSHGIERAVESGRVRDRESAEDWIAACLCFGAGRSDAILLAHSVSGGDAQALDELARALSPSRERHLETVAQGTAFAGAVSAWGTVVPPLAYPVAVGIAARAHGCPARETVSLYLNAFVSNLVSASIRLVPLGQTEGQSILSAMQARIGAVRDEAMTTSLDDIGGAVFLADMASMQHETQEVRLFRS